MSERPDLEYMATSIPTWKQPTLLRDALRQTIAYALGLETQMDANSKAQGACLAMAIETNTELRAELAAARPAPSEGA